MFKKLRSVLFGRSARGVVLRQRLGTVPWRSLTHAYGSGIDTPRLLQQVAAGDASGTVWEALFSSLAHQGTVYSASAAAAPFLVEMLEPPVRVDVHGVLHLLDAIASGSADHPQTTADCRRAVEAGFDRYLAILSSDAEATDVAAELCARFPERARSARPAFERALDGCHPDSPSRLELVRAYLGFAPVDAPDVARRLVALREDENPAIASTAALALIRASHPSVERCVSVVARGTVSETFFTAFDAVELLREIPAVHHCELQRALLELPSTREQYGSFAVGQALLWLAFGHRLGGPAARPHPFVMVHSLDWPVPVDTSACSPEHVESWDPSLLTWRQPSERDSSVEVSRTPFVHHWDNPHHEGPPWTEPPIDPWGHPGVSIPARIEPSSLSAMERRTAETLSDWDSFWKTDCDLLRVYGLPATRRALQAYLTE